MVYILVYLGVYTCISRCVWCIYTGVYVVHLGVYGVYILVYLGVYTCISRYLYLYI